MQIPKFEQKAPYKVRKRHWKWYFLMVIFGIFLAGVAFSAFKIWSFTHSIFKSNGFGSDIISYLPITANSYTSDIDKAFKNKQTINILLLGYGGDGHDGAYLTDSMLVASINPVAKNIALISIPRDMWVSIPISTTYSSYGKINSAYEIGLDQYNYQDRASKYKGQYGGGTMAEDVVSSVLGIPITYYVGIDFNAFKTIVDDLGGVDINVTNAFDDYQYPSGDNTTSGPLCVAPMNTPTTCRYWHVHFNAGLQHMDGQTALEYTRSRHALGIEGSDFARAQRQQKLLVAIKDKALQINALPNIFNILNALQNNVQTNLTISDVRDLTGDVKTWNLSNIDHEAITDQNFLQDSFSSDGQYILIPTAGMGDYSQIHQYINNIWNKPTLGSETKTVKIEIRATLADQQKVAALSTLLQSYGIETIQATKTLLEEPTQTVIYDQSNGAYPNTMNLLEQKTGGTGTTEQVTSNPNNANIVIALGADYSGK